MGRRGGEGGRRLKGMGGMEKRNLWKHHQGSEEILSTPTPEGEGMKEILCLDVKWGRGENYNDEGLGRACYGAMMRREGG